MLNFCSFIALLFTLLGVVMVPIGGGIYAAAGLDAERIAANCSITGARRSCMGHACTSWVCYFEFVSQCNSTMMVTGEAKRTSISYNGIGLDKTGDDCIRSIGLDPATLPTTNACWRKAGLGSCGDANSNYSLNDPEEILLRVKIICSIGGALFVLGAPILLFLCLTGRFRKDSNGCDSCMDCFD